MILLSDRNAPRADNAETTVAQKQSSTRLGLIAESDHDLRSHLAVNLRADGYDVSQAATPLHLHAN